MLGFQEALRNFEPNGGKTGKYWSLPALEELGLGKISRLPVSIRIILESLLRNCDGKRVRVEDVRGLAAWKTNEPRTAEIPFVVARVLLQDFTGVPLLVDMAAMRSAVANMNRDVKIIEPLVPVDLVIDHSVQVDSFGRPDSLQRNLAAEYERNAPRYQFLKWGAQAFETFRIVPPGIGICHQVNLEYLAAGLIERAGVYFPDTLVGTDSHTTMINGLGLVAWGVGGIEAEAAMLGQPVYFLVPDVVGVHLKGDLPEGSTATDIVLSVTQLLRNTNVVGKFVEFFGSGASRLPVAERATIANMAPEYGATMGFFPTDEETCRYFAGTGRSTEQTRALKSYYRAQEMFGIPQPGDCDYTQVVEVDLGGIRPSVAGPKRPQDRIDLGNVRARFEELFVKESPTGYGKPLESLDKRFPIRGDTAGVPAQDGAIFHELGHGDVLIAAITSCTNTSNPSVMLAAGLLAKNAVKRGLRVKPFVKTSLAPGSRVVTDYLQRTGLQTYLDQIGFATVGYGCTTCIGNSGPLDSGIDEAISHHDLIAASVLSGNRNFEARVHQSLKANFLMSPPLVVAFALAGTVGIDLEREPLGKGGDGNDVFLRDIWPSSDEIREVSEASQDPESFRRLYREMGANDPMWQAVASPAGDRFAWDPDSTYVQEPPYFAAFDAGLPARPALTGARALVILGDSITTDHISPAGGIQMNSPAGQYLIAKGVAPQDFNSYGARRGNHHVMVRATFANVRLKNLIETGSEGPVTRHQPSGRLLSIYDAAMQYQDEGVPLLVFAGSEYGTGSSRDWAAKGTCLLGVRAVIAKSFERIHRSNLVGMGVLPCQFKTGTDSQALGLNGTEAFDLAGLSVALRPRQDLTLMVRRKSGQVDQVPLILRIDTPIELEYYRNGGILPFVLRQLLGLEMATVG